MEFHVLLVEDDRVTLKTVEQLLRKCNYKVTCAANGREAMKVLSSCRQNGIKVDLILTDILMPEVTGFDLINEVVHGDTFCDVPVVVMSSQDSQESVLQAFQAGAADYLIKPIRKNELATLWQHVWRANKAKGSGSGNGAQIGRDGDATAAAKDGSGGGQVKDSSGGSSGAAVSVLQSTGGTTLPSHAASVRQPAPAAQGPGPSETSGDPLAEDTVNGLPHRHLHAHVHTHVRVHAGPAHGSSAAYDSGNVHGILGNSTNGDCTAIQHVAGRRFASVAVHFDLNPAPSPGRPQPCAHEAHGAAAGRQPNGHGTDANVAAATAGGTSATVISWSVGADPNERMADDGVPLPDDTAPKPKRPRLEGPAAASAPASGVSAAAAAAAAKPAAARPGSRLGYAGASATRLAAEGSQGSRAASGSGGQEGVREGTATPSAGEGFAESPSTYTSATATTTTTTSTTGSGSEAAEEQRQQLPHNEQEQEQPEATQGRYGRDTNGTGEGPGPAAVVATAVAPGVASRAHGKHGAAVRHTATSAGPPTRGQPPAVTAAGGSSGAGQGASAGPGPAQGMDVAGVRPPEGTAAAAAAGAEPHYRLPHPEAAAPGSAAPGGAVTLPPGLQELAVLGAQRHQELWTQRARLHQQQQLQQQQQQQQLQQQHRQQQQQQQQQRQERAEASARAEEVAPASPGPQDRSPQLVSASAAKAGDGAAGGNGSPAAAHAAAAAPPSPAPALADGSHGPVGTVREVPVNCAQRPGQEASQAGVTAATGAAVELAAAVGSGDGALPSHPSGLALLRHSERSAFTAFTVFLPGRIAAAAAAAAAAPTGAPAIGSGAYMSSTAAAGARPGQAPVSPQPPQGVGAPPLAPQLPTTAAGPSRPGVPAMYPAGVVAIGHGGGLLHPHPYAQPHAHTGLPSPSSVVLPPVVPLHTGHPPHAGRHQPLPAGAAKPQDPTAAPPPPPGGMTGALVPAAAAAAVAAHMPYAGMAPRPGAGLPFAAAPPHPPGAPPPVFIPEPVLQLIAHLSGRATAEIPVPETVTQAPVMVQKAPSAARLAAVAKYLEKRKHRNFQKKVRYESRKRLAEARPRVRGQFVKASAATVGNPTPPAAPYAPAGAVAAGGGLGAAATTAAAAGRGAGAAMQTPTHGSAPVPMDLDSAEADQEAEPEEEAAGDGEETDDSGAEVQVEREISGS